MNILIVIGLTIVIFSTVCSLQGNDDTKAKSVLVTSTTTLLMIAIVGIFYAHNQAAIAMLIVTIIIQFINTHMLRKTTKQQ